MIDAMTLFEVEELTCYWIEHPPLHLMISGFLGVGRSQGMRPTWPRQQPAASPRASGSVEELLAELGPALTTGDVHAGLGPVVIDFRELQKKTKAAAS